MTLKSGKFSLMSLNRLSLFWRVQTNRFISFLLLKKPQKSAPGSRDLRERYPLVIQYHRLRMIQEVMLSGFELKLYSQHELAFAYWYTIGPVRAQLEIIDELKEGVRDRSSGKCLLDNLTRIQLNELSRNGISSLFN
jgi:hypothetical protein